MNCSPPTIYPARDRWKIGMMTHEIWAAGGKMKATGIETRNENMVIIPLNDKYLTNPGLIDGSTNL